MASVGGVISEIDSLSNLVRFFSLIFLLPLLFLYFIFNEKIALITFICNYCYRKLHSRVGSMGGPQYTVVTTLIRVDKRSEVRLKYSLRTHARKLNSRSGILIQVFSKRITGLDSW